MKIVRLHHKYHEYLISVDEHFQREGLGVLIEQSGLFYYVPLTSKIYSGKPNLIKDNNQEIILNRRNKAIATIKIRDYYLIDYSLVISDIDISSYEREEIIYIRKNSKKIKSKLKHVLTKSKRRNKKVSKYYNNFYESDKSFISKNRQFGLRYFQDAMLSMSIVEGVNVSEENIYDIIKYNEIKMNISDTLDTFAVKTIINLKYAWDEVFRNLDESITLDYIIQINSLIAKDEALEINTLRKHNITVGGTHKIPKPDRENTAIDIQKFMMFKERHLIEKNVLSLYIYLITKQLFYDGNKRTAFLIANQMLISMGIGIIIIKGDDLIKFNKLLNDVYIYSSQENIDIFIKFLSEDCVIRIT